MRVSGCAKRLDSARANLLGGRGALDHVVEDMVVALARARAHHARLLEEVGADLARLQASELVT